MNFSTNQVMQMFVLNGTKKAAVNPIKTPDGTAVRGLMIQVVEGTKVVDNTDIIDVKNVLSVTEALATSDGEQLKRKGVLVVLNEDYLVDGNPVKGQDYVITINYRGNIGEEDTYSKVAEAHATKGDTPATLLQKLAESLILNQDVEYTPLYELYLPDGTLLTKENITTVAATGFYIVEPVPYWSLGRFEETLMKIDLQTAPIIVDGDDVIDWLENYKFEAVELASVPAIKNSHRVADLEYFCKGERGTSNAKLGWPDTPDYTPNVDPSLASGYDILTIHYAFVGANASNQKSEKDIILVAPAGAEGLNTDLAAVKTAIAEYL